MMFKCWSHALIGCMVVVLMVFGVNGSVKEGMKGGVCENMLIWNQNGTLNRLVDLSALVSLPTPISIIDQYNYTFAICSNWKVGPNGPVVGAYQSPLRTGDQSYPLGVFPDSNDLIDAFLDYDTWAYGAVVLNLSLFDGETSRRAAVVVRCDPSARQPSYFKVIQPSPGSPGPWYYQLILHHQSACGVQKPYIPPVGECHSLTVTSVDRTRTMELNMDQLSSWTGPFKVSDTKSPYEYQFRVCSNLQCPNGMTSGACQKDSDAFSDWKYSLGKFDSSSKSLVVLDPINPRTSLPSVTFQLSTSHDQDTGASRYSTIRIDCDPKVRGFPRLQPAISPPPSFAPVPFGYHFTLSHASACGTGNQPPIYTPPTSMCHAMTAETANGERKRIVSFDLLADYMAPLSFTDDQNTYTYKFGICRNIRCHAPWIQSRSDGEGKDSVAACQIPLSSDATQPFYSLGSYEGSAATTFTKQRPMDSIINFSPVLSFSASPAGAITWTLPITSDYRQVSITVICDPMAVSAKNISVVAPSPSSNPPYVYQISLSHFTACGKDVPNW